ncbi:TetR/AcrR family transcriptional regulator [Pelagicoccus sp. NFK12]|uniref:TetR/AcrR family transcriptional regulator n=1 Tax=Pelagicoccus enzymogenes TaxID=2773457 RepID=A0A927IEK4_9BACT|nr:TetR/AcrR family transcriptional regulator [Pelagicoccus enzymogenes]MBD5779142.1 TetR/AcrR family transcriptional regulator [Pelagicoccus enzymogenes]MDQ8201045.1 TetR/AcrR family transcriptional regulator [Pelagicoccus enzymogenes]
MARPIKHDRAQLLDTATALFWEKGYRGVSIKDLVKETGVLAGSLYSSYGSKDGVFVECIHRYSEMCAPMYLAAEQVESPLGQIEKLFEEVLEDATSEGGWRGCFVVNSLLEVAPDKPEIAETLKRYVEHAERWIAERLQQARERGELKAEIPIDEVAANLFGIALAVRVKSRAGESAERISSFAHSMLKSLLDVWKA